MSDVKIFWDPKGFELDSLGRKKYIRATDGDTPYISTSIRMLGIDTPEVHYPGNSSPVKFDAKLKELAGWIREGIAPVDEALGEYLIPRLETGEAGTLQKEQGEQAREYFETLLDRLLRKESGRRRSVYIQTADEPFDQYGRLLAYMAPSYTSDELAKLSRHERATFNYLMVESGWAASFLIYPSLPKHTDLVMLQEGAKAACENRRGAWENELMLTGYEFRMAVKLYNITKKIVANRNVSSRERSGWISRFCVDMTSGEIFYPQEYYKVSPYNRIFVWPADVTDAVAKMNLKPPIDREA